MNQEITVARRRELAELHGVNVDYLYQCLKGFRCMAPEEAMRLELATNGELRRVDLCQGRAHLIWPELATTEAPHA
jgi:DNA-binding transcriptional regulator YdaS (Cro superfamily)